MQNSGNSAKSDGSNVERTSLAQPCPWLTKLRKRDAGKPQVFLRRGEDVEVGIEVQEWRAANCPGVMDVTLEKSRMKCGWSAYPSTAATSPSVVD